MLTDDQDNAVDFVTYVNEQLGAKIWAKGDALMILPKGKLRPGDADFIRSHKAELLDVLANKRCCGVCPGVEHELCAGCPSPNIEIQFAGGLIAPQWCSAQIDKCATHWRERGGAWNEVER